MARRVMKKQVEVPKAPASSPVKKRKRSDGVEVVPVFARQLMTFDENNPVWKTSTLSAVGAGWSGAIVRLRPPADVEDGRVEQVKKAFVEAGAARVKIEARRKVVVPRRSHEKAPVERKRSTAREVVMVLVKESNTEDREALLEIVERTMSEENL